MSFCRFFSFIPCGQASSTVQPLSQDQLEVEEREYRDNKVQDIETSTTTTTPDSVLPSNLIQIPTTTAISTPLKTLQSELLKEEENSNFLAVEGEKMVDIRSSSMIKPCLIGSPPPSVLRERSKFRSHRLTQSRLADKDSQRENSSEEIVEETVIPPTRHTPAIHLSCSVDDDPPEEDDERDNAEISELDPASTSALATNNNTTIERSNSLTPPPRLLSFEGQNINL